MYLMPQCCLWSHGCNVRCSILSNTQRYLGWFLDFYHICIAHSFIISVVTCSIRCTLWLDWIHVMTDIIMFELRQARRWISMHHINYGERYSERQPIRHPLRWNTGEYGIYYKMHMAVMCFVLLWLYHEFMSYSPVLPYWYGGKHLKISPIHIALEQSTLYFQSP